MLWKIHHESRSFPNGKQPWDFHHYVSLPEAICFFPYFHCLFDEENQKVAITIFFHNLEGCDGTVNSFPGLLASQYVSNFEVPTIVIENHSWRKNDIHITK